MEPNLVKTELKVFLFSLLIVIGCYIAYISLKKHTSPFPTTVSLPPDELSPLPYQDYLNQRGK